MFDLASWWNAQTCNLWLLHLLSQFEDSLWLPSCYHFCKGTVPRMGLCSNCTSAHFFARVCCADHCVFCIARCSTLYTLQRLLKHSLILAFSPFRAHCASTHSLLSRATILTYCTPQSTRRLLNIWLPIRCVTAKVIAK